MIGKIIPRKHGVGSFRDSINYNLGLSKNETEKVEYVNTRNIFEPSMAIMEMDALAMENKLSKNPVFNCILSWRENEVPTHEQADEAVSIVLEEMGLERCQVHYALHRNTQNLHLHICVNRIDPETHRAIDPAHGWTKKAIEKAARKIEFAQGWEIEQSGRYVVTAEGQILEKITEGIEKPKLSQTAKDIEAHTGSKSAERIAQEIAAPIIRGAKSWGEIHQKLAEQGIVFERKGSGAVLCMGEVVVKASRAGRDISLSQLEKRLGAFRESAVQGAARPLYTEQAIESVESAPKVKSAWAQYQEGKSGYFQAKNAAFSEMRERHKKDRESLVRQQKQERGALFSKSWEGKGAELNRHRSAIAARQQGSKLTLRERHAKEREELKRQFPMRFPSFKSWLLRDKDPSLFVSFRYPGQPALFAPVDGKTETEVRSEKKCDIRNYSPVFSGTGRGVMYCKEGSSTADFIDYGKRIVFPAHHTEESTLAALQLASQKWGAVQLGGTDEYKKLCVRIAAKHNIRIANPELREEIEQTRKVTHHVKARDRGR